MDHSENRPDISAGNYQGKIVELEGLRGIAILLVTIHHFWPEGNGLYAYLSPLAHLGWIGVDLFFVISGLLIGGILLDTRDSERYYRNFYVRRVLRIFPLYYGLVAGLFVAVPLAQMLLHQVAYWETEFVLESGPPLWYLLFAGNIREAITGTEPAYFLAPLWSISIEEQFYLLSPLLIRHLSLARLKRVLVLFIVFSPCFRLAMLWLFPENERIQYLATLSRLDNLSVGVLLAVLIRTAPMPNVESTTRALIVLGSLLCIAFFSGGLDRNTWFCRVFGYSLLAAFFVALVFWGLQNRNKPAAAFLRTGWLVYLGSMCYGLYLLQRPAEVLLLKAASVAEINPDDFLLTFLVAKVVVSILVAHASWHLFEKPINRLKVRFQSANHPLDHLRQNTVAVPDARQTARQA